MLADDLDLTPSPLEQRRRIAAQRADYIDLSATNPTEHGLLFPPDLLRILAEPYWSARRYAPHPKGLRTAREAIAAYYARRTPALAVSPEQIFVTASTSEAYALLFTLLAAPGDAVLSPLPSYPLFAHLAAMRGVQLKPYHIAPDGAGRWALDSDGITVQADDRTRAILLISPHNPTGHTVDAALTLRGRAADLPIVADEVFCEFPYTLASVPPLGALMPETTVFHLNGISKMFALPDLKLGWIAISGPYAADYLDQLELLNDTLLSANSLTQSMLPSLFEAGAPFVAAMRRRIRGALDVALGALSKMPGIEVAPPPAGAYLFPRVRNCADEEALVMRMLDSGIFAHPGYFYDAEDACRLMLSAVLEPARLLEGIARLRAIL
ncbi:MAG: pyridoxal phosphate-dependent aminotransferase [Chloroflexi bacterium]|nr:pyridoxal phosphate-dependent aminotransferase [Chloroflexota bacterium]